MPLVPEEPDKPAKSDDEPAYKKWNVVVATIGSGVAVLVAINGLTGWNPLKDLTSQSGGASESATSRIQPSTTPEEVPIYDPPQRSSEVDEEPADDSSSPPEDAGESTETTAPASPQFQVTSSQWNGPCGDSWCSMSAIFRNLGGEGAGSATFYVLRPDANEYLARCSVVLNTTSENGVTSAGCTASSGWLQAYIRSHPGTTVRMQVTVDY